MKTLSTILFATIFLIIIGFKPKTEKMIVVIDPGHGGKDLGATFNETLEKDIVFEISTKILALNKNKDIEFVLLRYQDEFATLTERAEAVNKINPDLFISLHANQTELSHVNGVEAFVYGEGKHVEKSMEYASALVESLAKSELNPRGVKQVNFLVLRKVNCPAVTLELGFITNDADREFLTSQKGQTKIAKKIIESLN